MKKTMIAFLLLGTLSAKVADFHIKDYGAQSDTTVLSTKAIQQAIDACS